MKGQEVRESLRNTYDGLSQEWGKDFSLHDWGVRELGKFTELVKEAGGKRVLDLGCASGVQSELLVAAGLEVTGVDISPGMIKEAAKRVPQAKFMTADIASLPFKEEEFDGIYARASLLHIPKDEIEEVLVSLASLLVPGGYFYMAVKEGVGEGEFEDTKHGRRVKRFYSLYQEKELRNLLEESGFEIIDIDKHQRLGGSTIWIQVLGKKD